MNDLFSAQSVPKVPITDNGAETPSGEVIRKYLRFDPAPARGETECIRI